MASMPVRGHRYIIGIQADVTDVDLDMASDGHPSANGLGVVADQIFSGDCGAWMQVQAHKLEVQAQIQSSEISKNASQQENEAGGQIIKIAGQNVHNKNTFLHVMDSSHHESNDFGRKRSASDPFLQHLVANNSSGSSAEEVPSNSTMEDSTQTYPNGTPSTDNSMDASAENSNSEGSRTSTSDNGRQQHSEFKSVGSAGHPERCTECTFYFFGAQGCRKGSDCRFCHEFHPRKSSRKNRRLLKRIAVGGIPIPEENTGDSSTHTVSAASASCTTSLNTGESSTHATADCSTLMSAATSGSDDEEILFSAAEPSASAKDQPYSFGTSAVMSVRYLSHGAELEQAKLTLLVGQEVHLPAVVEMDSCARGALEDVLSFSVDPPLQHSLTLDPSNGLISGVAMEVQARKLHVVTASTVATGHLGIKLGLVPLARTSLLVRIVDLRSCKASSVYTVDGDDDDRILVEFTVPASSDGIRPAPAESKS
mmetsp:Transcript_5704/g.10147  ORF Transcript_5704/g.10147 Transcript_5704/m.10147 type:complete len:482 (+) Transcript_5704:31-1476(+)